MGAACDQGWPVAQVQSARGRGAATEERRVSVQTSVRGMSGDAKHGDGNQVEGLVKHVMADGRGWGRRDGHKGAHRSPAAVERNPVRYRACMADPNYTDKCDGQ